MLSQLTLEFDDDPTWVLRRLCLVNLGVFLSLSLLNLWLLFQIVMKRLRLVGLRLRFELTSRYLLFDA